MAAKKTTAKKSSRAKAKRDVGGRPSKYLASYNEQARRLALLGQTDAQMAEFFGIGESTLNRWKLEHDGFRESILAGKQRADADVAESLYRTALGGGTVTEVREEPDAEGNVKTAKITRELPANTTAQRFWLTNRQPQAWRTKIVTEDETPPEAIAATVNKFMVIMEAARARQRQVLIERGILPDGEAGNA